MITGRTAAVPACHMDDQSNMPVAIHTASEAARNTRTHDSVISVAWRIWSVVMMLVLPDTHQ